MFQETIGKFFGIGRKVVRSDSVSNAFMQTRSHKGGLLAVCLSAALLFTFCMSYAAQADIVQADLSATTSIRSENSSAFQSNSPISPIALGEQGVTGSSVNTSKTEDSAAADGVFHQADEALFPISSGKQVNQTSLVLVGAVLVALTMVVGLAIGRKES